MKKFRLSFLGILLVLGLTLTGCSVTRTSSGSSSAQSGNTSSTNTAQTNTAQPANSTTNADSTSQYPNSKILVDTAWVKKHLNDKNIAFVDMRGAKAYAAGHIPGATVSDYGKLADPNNKVAGYLLTQSEFKTYAQNLGIGDNDTVVVYDDGSSLSAARLFYALQYYGHENVKLLNGGMTAWLKSGNDVSTKQPTIKEATFTVKPQPSIFSTEQYVENNTNNKNVVILDARSPGEYSGKDVRAARGGHIPNAININWTNNITTKDGVKVLKSASALEKQYQAAGITKDKTVVPYCQTNVRGAQAYFTLKLLGYKNVKPYEGSWSQWGNDPKAPIQK